MGCRNLSFFNLGTLLFLFIFSSHSLADEDATNHQYLSKSGSVNLSLYYESLCPYCANFIVNELVNVFNTDLYTIVNLKLVPWGNAQVQGNNSIICQHGEDECYLNTIHACAIKAWPVRKHFNFIHCLEAKVSDIQDRETAWKDCCDDLGLSQEPIDDCYNSGRGTELVLENANETDALNPPHGYVPWVTINDRALEEDYDNYEAYVCRAYKGKNVPDACHSYSQISTMKKTSNSSAVCYAESKVPRSAESASKTQQKLMKMEPQA